MRLTKTQKILNTRLKNTIRRSYPLIGSAEMQASFDALTDPGFSNLNMTKEPWIEALPKYKPLEGQFNGLKTRIPSKSEFVEFLKAMHQQKRGDIFPPYVHQAESIEAWANDQDFVVSTGTGSGKTECFLYPVLGHLHEIASRQKTKLDNQGEPDKLRGMKAIVLYPMNALVGDQLKRMRTLLGDYELAKALSMQALHQGVDPVSEQPKNRFFQFGSYTGRTRFSGPYAYKTARGKKNPKVLKGGSGTAYVKKFTELETNPKTGPQAGEKGLYMRMMAKGLIPAKGVPKTNADGDEYWSLKAFLNETGTDGLITRHEDRELLMRHEMHNVGYNYLKERGQSRITDDNNGGGTPDVLITNYSMLEYMLKRPLEHIMFKETRDWLKENGNKLVLVLDEAHLYQGALGTEIGMLLRRLRMALGIAGQEEKIQFILTSASLGKEDHEKEVFVQGLTGRPKSWFDDNKTAFIDGTKWEVPEPMEDLTPLDSEEWIRALERIDLDASDEEIRTALTSMPDTPTDPTDEEAWFNFARTHEIYAKMYEILSQKAVSISALAESLLGSSDGRAVHAMELILNFVAALKGELNIPNRKDPLLGIRAHLLYRGLTELYWNLESDRIQTTQTPNISSNQPAAIYPVHSCRRCGGAYAQVFVSNQGHSAGGESIAEQLTENRETSHRTFGSPLQQTVQIEAYVADEYDPENKITKKYLKTRTIDFQRPPDLFLHKKQMRFCTFKFFENSDVGQKTIILNNYRPAYLARVNDDAMVEVTDSNFKESGCLARYSFNKTRCMQCETNHENRSDQITSLMTRGDQAFSSLSLGLHQSQDNDDDVPTPNRGKKVLIFSDGRQRAARLAKTVQDFANNDELRLSILHLIESKWYKTLAGKHNLFSLSDLYPLYVIHITAAMQDPFEETANYFNPKAMFANNREGIMSRHLAGLAEIKFSENITIPGPNGSHETFVHDFITKLEKVDGDDLDAMTIAELFVNPVNRAGLNEGTMEQIRKALNQRTGFALLKHMRNKVLIRRILAEGISEFSNLRFGCLLLLLKEVIGDVESEADALSALQGVVIDANQLKQKMDAAGCGITQSECDKIAERWDLLRQSGAITDPQLMSLFDLSEKNIDERRSSMQALRKQTLQVMAWWLKEMKPLEPYDKRVQKAALLIREEYNSLPEYASLCLGLQGVECLIYEATDADAANRLLLFKSHVITNVDNYMTAGTNVPTFFFTQLIDFISSRDFSLEDLGLGTIQLLDKMYERMLSVKQDEGDFPDPLSNEQRIALRVLYEAAARFPIMSTGNFGLKVTGKDSSRGIVDEGEDMYNIHAAKAHPREHKLKMHPEKWGATSDQLNRYFAHVLEVKTSPLFKDVKALFPNFNQLDNLNPFFISKDGRRRARANSLQLVNKSNQTEGVLMCVRCGATLMHALEVFTKACAKCGATGETLIRPYDPDEPLIRLRVEDPWREPARVALASQVEEMAITLVRAEEHTAQINDPTSQDEMYSHAERFEMLFQDIPLVVPDDDAEFTAAESPVDILSCTTTMEVGIDIGSLTAVALRTVPRERANYQQRVGRAGRGRAEVCVALSWYDNKPYAQHFFSNPSDIIDHPENSPVIYLDNEVIVQRHIWAAILQRFFKRLKFDDEDLMFYGMDADQQKAGLMDSMGTKDNFLEGDFTSEQLYTLKGLKAWMAGTDGNETQNPDDGEDMRKQDWPTTRDELATLLPEGLHNKVWLPDESRFATAPEEVIDAWMSVLIERFDELNIGFQGGEEE